MQSGCWIETSSLDTDEGTVESIFAQSQFDETILVFSTAVTVADLSVARTKLVRANNDTKKTPISNFLVILLTSYV